MVPSGLDPGPPSPQMSIADGARVVQALSEPNRTGTMTQGVGPGPPCRGSGAAAPGFRAARSFAHLRLAAMHIDATIRAIADDIRQHEWLRRALLEGERPTWGPAKPKDLQ